jgi:hypothetical protein
MIPNPIRTIERIILYSKTRFRKISDRITVNKGNVMEIAKASVVPSSFWASKYAVSPITCPKRKLRNVINHKFHGNKKIYVNIPKTTAIIINVKVPIAVRKKLMKTGLA